MLKTPAVGQGASYLSAALHDDEGLSFSRKWALFMNGRLKHEKGLQLIAKRVLGYQLSEEPSDADLFWEWIAAFNRIQCAHVPTQSELNLIREVLISMSTLMTSYLTKGLVASHPAFTTAGLEYNHNLQQSLGKMLLVDNVVDAAMRIRTEVIPIANFEIFCTGRLFIIKDVTTKKFSAYSESFLLCLRAITTGEFNLVWYSWLSDLVGKYKTPMHPLYVEFLRLGKAVREVYKNNAFSIFKMVESFSLGYVLRNEDLFIESSLYATINKATSQYPDAKPFFDFLRRVGKTDPLMLLEMSKTVKVFGHPKIEYVTGIKSLRQRCEEIIEPDIGTLQLINCITRKVFCQGFFAKNKRWPKLLLGLDCKLEEFVTSNTWPSSRIDAIPLIEWSNFRYQKNLPFDYHPDLFDLINDKSVAPNRADWAQSFTAAGFRQNGQYKPERLRDDYTSQKKLVLAFLSAPGFESEKMVHAYELNGLPAGDRYIELVPKELELKIEGRFFAVQTIGARLIQTILEANLAASFLACFPTTSMSLSDPQLRQVLETINRALGSHAECLAIGIDFSNWNQTFRSSTLTLLTSDLDDIYGFAGPVYRRAMTDYHEYLVMLKMPNQPPFVRPDGTPDPSESCWYGHIAGFEGLRQKLWTVFTSSLALFASNSLELRALNLGQGDNQTVLIRVPPHYHLKILLPDDPTISGLYGLIINRITIAAKMVGLKVKPEESYGSTVLYAYNKQITLKGVMVSNSAQKVMRMTPHNNALTPSIETNVAAIFGTSEQVAQGDVLELAAYLMGILHALLYLSRYHYRPPGLMPLEIFIPVALFPKCLGGLPFLLPSMYSYRGDHDELVQCFSFYRHLSFRHPQVWKKVAGFACWDFTRYPNKLQLLLNIFSLPVDRPNSPANVFQEELEEFLTEAVANSKVQGWFQSYDRESCDKFVNELFEFQPCPLFLLPEIFRLSPMGKAHGLASMFTKVASVAVATLRSEADDLADYLRRVRKLVDVLNASSDDLWEWILFKVKRAASLPSKRFSELNDWTDSPGQNARITREKAWGLDFGFLSYHHPMDQYLLLPAQKETVDSSIQVIISKGLPDSCHKLRTDVGPFPFFKGGKTKELKYLAPGTKGYLVGHVNNMRLLQQIMGFLAPRMGREATEHLLKLAGFSPNVAALMEGTSYTRGSGEHRAYSAFNKKQCFSNSSALTSTHIMCLSDYLKDIRRGGQDFNLHFQALFMSIDRNVTWLVAAGWHQHLVSLQSWHAKLLFGREVRPLSEAGISHSAIISHETPAPLVEDPLPEQDMKYLFTFHLSYEVALFVLDTISEAESRKILFPISSGKLPDLSGLARVEPSLFLLLAQLIAFTSRLCSQDTLRVIRSSRSFMVVETLLSGTEIRLAKLGDALIASGLTRILNARHGLGLGGRYLGNKHSVRVGLAAVRSIVQQSDIMGTCELIQHIGCAPEWWAGLRKNLPMETVQVRLVPVVQILAYRPHLPPNTDDFSGPLLPRLRSPLMSGCIPSSKTQSDFFSLSIDAFPSIPVPDSRISALNPRSNVRRHWSYLNHSVRPVGLTSSAASKYDGIVRKVLASSPGPGLIIGLAEGSGSLLNHCLILSPGSKALHVTLLFDHDLPSYQGVSQEATFTGMDHRYLRHVAWDYPCDLLRSATVEKVISIISTHTVQLITFDAESADLPDYDHLLFVPVEVAQKVHSQAPLLIKLLLHRLNEVRRFLHRVVDSGYTVMLNKPLGSGAYNTEIIALLRKSEEVFSRNQADQLLYQCLVDIHGLSINAPGNLVPIYVTGIREWLKTWVGVQCGYWRLFSTSSLLPLPAPCNAATAFLTVLELLQFDLGILTTASQPLPQGTAVALPATLHRNIVIQRESQLYCSVLMPLFVLTGLTNMCAQYHVFELILGHLQGMEPSFLNRLVKFEQSIDLELHLTMGRYGKRKQALWKLCDRGINGTCNCSEMRNPYHVFHLSRNNPTTTLFFKVLYSSFPLVLAFLDSAPVHMPLIHPINSLVYEKLNRIFDARSI